MDFLDIVTALQERDRYLCEFDQLLVSLGGEEAASLEEIQQLFITYESPDMPALSAEIEAMREER